MTRHSITITVSGPTGSHDFRATSADDRLVIRVDGRDLLGVDFDYAGLPGSETDLDGRAKVIVGCWPDGEQWERICALYLDKEAPSDA